MALEQVDITVSVNGRPRRLRAGATIAELLGVCGFAERRVAVAVNRAVVPRARHAEHALDAGDEIDVVQAVGGG